MTDTSQFPQSAARIVDGRLIDASFLTDAALVKVLSCLNGAGEETRIVGGAVRNALLGETISDVDLASTALPDEIMRRAAHAGIRTIPTGIDHGTITLLSNGRPFEVTTLRQDIETDGRHAIVRFGRDFEADALRRDFTMNALSIDAAHTVHDYCDGLRDLSSGVVRFIGDPNRRIREDYLRILRLFRMHAAYGSGDVDRPAFLAAIAGRAGLSRLSSERIGVELKKLLLARRAADAVAQMTWAGLLVDLTGGIANHIRLAHLTAAEKSFGLEPDAMLRLIALAVVVEEDAARLFERLRLSKAEAVRISQTSRALAAMHALIEPPEPRELSRLLFLHGRRAAMDVIILSRARLLAAGAVAGSGDRWISALHFVHDTPIPRLPFTGADIVRRGIPTGPAVGAVLTRFRAAWIRAGFPKDPSELARLLDEALSG